MATDVRGTAAAAAENAIVAQSISNPNQTQVAAQASLVNQNLTTRADVSSAARVATQIPSTQTPVYDSKGNLTGYNVVSYDEFGKAQPVQFVSSTANATSATGQSSAFETFKAQFAALGLGSLADSLVTLSQSPNAPQTSDGYYLALLQTPEYKARFGDTNAMRIANGLPALTEAQILKNEQDYQDVMRQYGMPSGFYDQPSDYQKFIALDKSPAEVASIIQSYTDLARQQDPNVLAQLKQYYNLDVSHVAASLMDPTKAQPIINALTQNGTTAAAAGSAGVQDITTAANMANTMGAGTLDYAKQAQAFAQAQQLSGQATNLAQRYSQLGTNYNFASGLQEALSGPEAVQAQFARQRLATAETSQFGGSAGADTKAQSLGIASEQGVQ